MMESNKKKREGRASKTKYGERGNELYVYFSSFSSDEVRSVNASSSLLT